MRRLAYRRPLFYDGFVGAVPASSSPLGVKCHCMWLLGMLVGNLLLHWLRDGQEMLDPPAISCRTLYKTSLEASLVSTYGYALQAIL